MTRLLTGWTGFLFVLLPAALSAEGSTPLFWERNITQALNSRDYFYREIGLNVEENGFGADYKEDPTSLLFRLSRREGKKNAWHHLLASIANESLAPDSSRIHFQRAVALSARSPGMLWVLFLEYRRAGVYSKASHCLNELESLFLRSGATDFPVVSKQLILLGRGDVQNLSPKDTLDYLNWASRFERIPFWPNVIRGLSSRFDGISIHQTLQGFGLVGHSWLLQLRFVNATYMFIRYTILFFVSILLMGLAARTLAKSLHAMTHLYPQAVPVKLRLVFSAILILSILSFGLLPFLFILALLTWNHVEDTGKKLVTGCIIAMILFPLDSYLRTYLLGAMTADSPIGIYGRTIDEGYSEDLDRETTAFIRKSPDHYLSFLSGALVSYKKGDLQTALMRIGKAGALRSDDPVVLITAGNIHFAAGRYRDAGEMYRKCMREFPNYEEAYYNLGQYRMASMETLEGTKLISRATRMDNRSVNTFTERNLRHFSDSWPWVRQVMQPDYNPKDFWSGVFWGSGANIRPAGIWGASFFGFPPAASSVVMAAFFALIGALRNMKRGGRRRGVVRKLFFCRVCGAVMCRKCKTGGTCLSCLQATQKIDNARVNASIRFRIQQFQVNIRTIIMAVLDSFFPGAGKLYISPEERILHALPIISVTSIVYSYYHFIWTVRFSVPFRTVKDFFTAFTILCLGWSAIWLIRSAHIVAVRLRAREADNGA